METELIPFKKFIGCADCCLQWETGCPVCKDLGNKLMPLDGNSVPLKHYKFVKKDGFVYYFEKVVHNPPKIQHGIDGKEEERRFWSKYHPKPVVKLILQGHEAACRCCFSIENLTRDHILPIAKNGKNTFKNSQILCYNCNQKKGNEAISIEELRKLINNQTL